MEALRDPVASSSHLFFCAAAVVGTLFLWRFTRKLGDRRIAALIFGGSMIFLYGASGLFHALTFSSDEERRFYQKIDQSAIYVLIAGTYTPVFWCLLRGRLRASILIAMWLLAVSGICCMWLLPKLPHEAMVGIYLGMGWLGCLPVYEFYKAVGWTGLRWAMLGAAAYTFGAVCELTNWPWILSGITEARFGPHEILHLSDIVGTTAHYVFIIRYVLPYRRPSPATRTAPRKPLPLRRSLAMH